MSEPTPHNQQAFVVLLKQIQHVRQNVFFHINTTLIDLYWHIQKALIENMKQFILELGGDFIFIVVYRR
ncbi:hypothetical protein BAZOLSSOX_1159 [uncultured Gammaproteobacteria bacterium]|jgi:hypothetical protein|nr:hypothetical protein BAZOLSSOX_1159 [uncultured Gammaproteobacteria bacterium]